MHIGLDARLVYYRRYSGIGQYIVHLAEHLAGLDDKAHSFTLLHNGRDRNPPHHPRTSLHAMWTPSHHRLEQLALPLELATLRLDLLHSPDFIPPFRSRFKRVITVHDLNFLYYPQFLTSQSHHYYNDQIQRAVEVADHILADSRATRLDLIKLLSVPEEKISVVWLAPDAIYGLLPPDELAAAQRRLQLPGQYLLFAGTLEPRKNVAALLRAYRLLLDRNARLPDLILAGSRGWLFDETQTLIVELHLAEHVRWIDSPPAADLAALYNAASLLILPSHYEGFGLTVLEAMACGTPVIISDRGSLPEIAGGAALIVDPDDTVELAAAIERVLGDVVLQADLRLRGLARVAEFSWERCARETLAVYDQVLNQ